MMMYSTSVAKWLLVRLWMAVGEDVMGTEAVDQLDIQVGSLPSANEDIVNQRIGTGIFKQRGGKYAMSVPS
jgi:hypothetical protein